MDNSDLIRKKNTLNLRLTSKQLASRTNTDKYKVYKMSKYTYIISFILVQAKNDI